MFVRVSFRGIHNKYRPIISSKVSLRPATIALSRIVHHDTVSNQTQSKPALIWEERYKNWKDKNPAKDELMRFTLKNIVYGLVATGVAYSFKEYVEANKRLERIALIVENQAGDNVIKLKKMQFLRSQPFLYLTTRITIVDKQEFDKNQAELAQIVHQLNGFSQELEALCKFPLTNRIEKLKKRLEQEIEQMDIAQAFNETIWLQKNRRYSAAIAKNKAILEKLEAYKKSTQKPIFDLSDITAAAYNAQAKLEACLAFFSNEPEEKQRYRTNSLAAYNLAIAELENNPDSYAVELATLKSSKGYLLVDSGKPEEALKLQQEANTLKPHDEYILCGIGLALYEIEKNYPSPSRAQLDEAYGYFTRAIQLNDKVSNIYVSRGKLLLELQDVVGALEDFDSALKLDPHHSEANIQKSHILLQENACAKAKSLFKQGLVPLIGRQFEIEKQRAIFTKRLGSCPPLEADIFYSSTISATKDKNQPT